MKSTVTFVQKTVLQNLAVCIAMLVTVLIFTSCKKDPPANNPYYDQQLVINFTSTTVPFNLFDSASVIFKKQGSATEIFKRFEKKNNSIAVVINDLSKGTWTAEVYIYTRSTDTTARRYFQAIVLTALHEKNDITTTGPNGKVDDTWKPSAMLINAQAGIIVTVSMDNREPSFDIQASNKKWDHFYMERYAHNRTNIGNEQMASATWECNNSCYTNDNWLVNHTAFIPFAETVKTKIWNNGEIYVLVGDTETNEEKEFFYLYNR